MAQEIDKDAGRVSLNKPVTLTFPNLLEAKAVQRNGKPTGDPKFSGNFEFEAGHPDLDALKRKALERAKAKWPGRDIGAEIKAGTFQWPFSNGAKLADKAKLKGKDREFSRDKTVLNSRSKFQPRLSIIEGGKMVDLESDDVIKMHGKKFYSGTEVLAQFNFQAYDGVGSNGLDGVTAYLDMVLTLNRGQKVAGGGPSAADVFKGYAGSVTDEDPTTGLDDDGLPD